MNNEIEKIAEQNGMSVEFASWFFNEKKAGCGNAWFIMMAAMWEGWKARDGEIIALALTIEKCREIVGCPAGVDLQDHLRQLAAENVGPIGGESLFNTANLYQFVREVESMASRVALSPREASARTRVGPPRARRVVTGNVR